MPTYAILGGTGNTGSELVKQLSQSSDSILHIYARSHEKLLKAHPALAQSNSPHSVFTGGLGDEALIAKCLADTDIVFAAVGTNNQYRGLHIAQELAQAIITALETLRANAPTPKEYNPPTVVFITSAGMTSDKRVRANFPGYLHAMLQVVGKYIYADFREATAMFRHPKNYWIPTIFFCAPGLTLGPSQGEITVGVQIPKKAPVYVTYTDLARGMIKAGKEPALWQNREIGIVGARMRKVDNGSMMLIFIANILAVYAPALWSLGHRRQWW